MIDTKTFSSTIESVILSAFPKVSTHLKHTTDQSLSTQLFPYDNLLAAFAVSFNRYTVKYPNESKFSRLVWSALLGTLAYLNYDYWILISLHLVSFGQFVYAGLEKWFQTVRCITWIQSFIIVEYAWYTDSSFLYSTTSIFLFELIQTKKGEEIGEFSNDANPSIHDMCLFSSDIFGFLHFTSRTYQLHLSIQGIQLHPIHNDL